MQLDHPLPKRLHWPNIFWLSFSHLVAVLAIFHFSWSALFVCLIGVFVLSPLGVNLAYHRLLTHGSFKVPAWLEYVLVTIGAAIGGGPPLQWVAEHRLHHRFSDTAQDPHNARQGFLHSHITHLFHHKEFEDQEEQWMRYVPELSGNRYFRFLNRYWIYLTVATTIPLYWAGGISFVLWGGFVRAVLMLHCTWLVNSASHLWGYRNYKTRDASTNCWWAAILAAGEGWHNNHHAFPTSAAHGHRWWELDATYLLICFFERLGLAKDVRRPDLHYAPVKLAEAKG